ncbi:protein containing TPR repeat [Anaerolinea thermolimosa]|nr:protein containing TPR repeat [Anaerolinea thermolimosa]
MMGLKILLPLLFLAGINLAPVEFAIAETLEQARVAEVDDQPVLAMIRYREALERHPWERDLWEHLGRMALIAGAPEEAIHAFEQADRLFPLSPDTRKLLADAYESCGRYEDAARQWAEVAAVQPTAENYAHLSDAWQKAGRLSEAVQALRRWREIDPKNGLAAYRLALDVSISDLDEALNLVKEAARLDQAFQEGMKVLERVGSLSSLDDDPAYRLTLLGRALGELNEWALAERALTEAVHQNPDYAEAWALLGETRYHTGGDGRVELEKALELNPSSVLGRVLMAFYWSRKGDWQQAIDQMAIAARLEPARSMWRVELGNLYAQKGDLPQALIEYRRAVDLDPNNPAVLEALAQFCLTFQVQVEETGLPAAREAVKLDDQSAHARALLGALLAATGHTEEAEKELARALELDDHLAEAHYYLGSLYLTWQRMELAQEHLFTASRLDPQGRFGILASRLLAKYFHGEADENGSP